MFCKSCGTQIEENASFCPNCGAPVDRPVQPVYQQSQQTVYQQPAVYQQPLYGQVVEKVSAEANGLATSALVFGILGLVFSELLGLIFSIIGLSKAKAAARYGPLPGKARAGKILATIGLVFSIIGLAGIVVYAVVALGLLGVAAYSSYHY